jgi:mRNA-degrading endonuclease toxin of MazEF toxin-antitoxin module
MIVTQRGSGAGSLPSYPVAPLTTTRQACPWRVAVTQGRIALDQLRPVDGEGLVRRLGVLDTTLPAGAPPSKALLPNAQFGLTGVL